MVSQNTAPSDPAEPVQYPQVMIFAVKPDELLCLGQAAVAVHRQSFPGKSGRQAYAAMPLDAFLPAFEILWYHILSFGTPKLASRTIKSNYVAIKK